MYLSNSIKRIFVKIRREIFLLIEPISGYTRLVISAKTFFIILASLLIIIILLLPFFGRKKEDYVAADGKKDNKHITTSTMMNPNYHGSDKNGRIFDIYSDTATKMTADKLILTNVFSKMQINNKDWLNGKSTQAIYNTTTRNLDLFGNVELIYNDEYILTTRSANVNFLEYSASGHQKVYLSGILGKIVADGFIMPDEDNLLFKGNVFTTIYPNNVK